VPATPGVPDPISPGGKRPGRAWRRRSCCTTGVRSSASELRELDDHHDRAPDLLDRLDFGLPLPDAIDAPRASQRNTPTNVAEPGFIAQYGADLQARFGQLFTSTPEIGAATASRSCGREQQAAAEPTAEVAAPPQSCARPKIIPAASAHAVCSPVSSVDVGRVCSFARRRNGSSARRSP